MPSKINPVWYAVSIPLLAIVVAAALVLWRKSAPTTLSRFSVEQYNASPVNFMGNTYVVDGQIEGQLAYEPNVGRLMSVRLQDGKRFAVFAPAKFTENLAVGQRYRMDINIASDGIILLDDIQKL